MSRLDGREAEPTLNTILLCGMGGLLMGLVGATVLIYMESEPDTDEVSGQTPEPDATQDAPQPLRLSLKEGRWISSLLPQPGGPVLRLSGE